MSLKGRLFYNSAPKLKLGFALWVGLIGETFVFALAYHILPGDESI